MDGLGKYQLCVPAKAGAATGAITGLVIWTLVSYVPAFRSGVPEPLAAALPFVLGFLGHVLASWVTAHPGRPVPPLTPQVAIPGVTAVPAAAPAASPATAGSSSPGKVNAPEPAAGTAGLAPSGTRA